MATTSMDYEAANGDRYEGTFCCCAHRRVPAFVNLPGSLHDFIPLTHSFPTDEAPRYERDNRSASPRPLRDEHEGGRRRSASPGGNPDRFVHPPFQSPMRHLLTIHSSGMKDAPGPRDRDRNRDDDDDGAINPGSNLFVTGIHPKLSEAEVTKMFEKYGDVEKCQIMRDPHTKESRGFGFVKMVTSDQAEAAKEGLQGETIEGRTLSIEKARRARPRTPTPGKYFGPPKRGKIMLSSSFVLT